MEGILIGLNRQERMGRVDTRNDQLKVLNLYFGNTMPLDICVNCTIDFEVITSKIGTNYAKFTSMVDRNQAIFNTEDRSLWYSWGENFENDFITKIVPQLRLDIRQNPEKDTSPWAIDLFDFTNNRPADLKVQNTPFFTAGKYRYGKSSYNPCFTVTFNKKDYENYLLNNHSCDIYFWVNWTQLDYKGIHVERLNGVWRASFSMMASKIQSGIVALHSYIHRTNDDHNAKESYLFLLSDTDVFEKML